MLLPNVKAAEFVTYKNKNFSVKFVTYFHTNASVYMVRLAKIVS